MKYSQLTRAIQLSSNMAAVNRSLQKISQLFLANNYPADLITKTKKNCLKVRYSKDKCRPKVEKKNNQIYMRLPYVDEVVSKRVCATIAASKAPISIAWMSGQTLGDTLMKSALEPPKCPSGHKKCHTCESGLKNRCNTRMVVYRIDCAACKKSGREEFYVGESRRPVRYRFNEHLSNARLRHIESPFGDHMLDYHPNMSIAAINTNFLIDILCVSRDVADVKINESIFIKKLRPTLNKAGSSWPTTKFIV